MQIRMLKDRRRSTAGQVLEVSDGVANVLIRRKMAELYVPSPESPRKTVKRRSFSNA